MVATPAAPVKGSVVQQWMCDAVVVPSKPLNDASTANVFATSSVVTVAEPIPGELFGGDSPGPVRLAKYVTIFAWAVGVGGISTTANASKQEPIEMRDSFMFASLSAAFNFDFMTATRLTNRSQPPQFRSS